MGVSASEGGVGLSWDALNHHIYLGWTAQGHRLDQDALPAAFQSLQIPYLYWPAYQLAMLGVGPVQAVAVLSALHALAVPPVWMVARTLIPGPALDAMAMRVMAVMLAFLSSVILSLTDNTANDLLAAIPLLWAVALAMRANEPGLSTGIRQRRVLVSGLLAGVATTLKFSNGPMVLLMPLLWAIGQGSLRWRSGQVVRGGVATVAGFVLTYGYWGWQLWTRYGNPMYPFHDQLFASLRDMLGWMP